MADIIINGIPEESINSIQVGDKEFIAITPPQPGYYQGMADLSLGLGLYDPIEEVVPNWLDENKFSFYGFTARYGFDVDKPGFVDENSHEIAEKTYYVQTEEKLITPADSGDVFPSNGKLISEIQISAPNPADIRKGVSIYGSIGTLEFPDGQLYDLTGTCWIFNEEVNVSDLVGAVSAYSNRNYNINFITDDDKGEFEHIYLESTHAYGDTFKYGNGLRLSKYISVYDSHSGWNRDNQRWRSIRITGGSDATNKYLIAWLLTNAVRV